MTDEEYTWDKIYERDAKRKEKDNTYFPALVKHNAILKKIGMTSSENPILSIKLGVPMKRIPDLITLKRMQDIIDFQKAQHEFKQRQKYYNFLQHQDPTIRLDPEQEFRGKDPYEMAYRRVQDMVNRLRYSGIIPFDSVIDDSDTIGTEQQMCNVGDYLLDKATDYRSNWFENQSCYLEIWLEKRSLEREIAPVTDELGVYISCSGKEPTDSQIHSGLVRYAKMNKDLNYLLYLGDLDPDGKMMVKSLDDKIDNMRYRWKFPKIKIIEIGLNPSQVDNLKLHQNVPLKASKNNPWYTTEYQIAYWTELDALSPNQLRDLVRREILKRLDYNEILRKQQEDQKNINVIQTHLQTFNP